MSSPQTPTPAASHLKPIVGAATILNAVILIWGYLRVTLWQASIIGEEVQQLAPEVEERNRMLEDLAKPSD